MLSGEKYLKKLGIYLVIFIFVFIQFVEYNLFTVGNVPISIQKLLALIFFPFGLILIGKIKIPKQFTIFAVLLLNCYVLALFFQYHIILLNSIYSALLVVTIGYLGAIVVYNALRHHPNNLRFFAKIWIIFACITSVICILQSVGIFPYINLSAEGIGRLQINSFLSRGTGLKSEPNFQSIILFIGFIFSFYYQKKK